MIKRRSFFVYRLPSPAAGCLQNELRIPKIEATQGDLRLIVPDTLVVNRSESKPKRKKRCPHLIVP